MMQSIPLVTKEELKRIQLVGCGLNHWQGTNENAIQEIIKKMGFIQLDPLNPAGRYHDIFFFARIPDYSVGQFEKIAYAKVLIFETYFHNLNAISIEHFPFFYSYSGRKHLGRYYTRLLMNLEKISETDLLEEVYEYVVSHGPTKSSDLTELGKADPKYASWKSNRNSGTVLELLWAIGKLAVVERDSNFRKIYNLVDRYVDKELLMKRSYSEEERANYRLKLKLKAFSNIPIGKLSATKKGKIKSNRKVNVPLNNLISSTESNCEYNPTLVRLDDNTGYIVPSNWSELSKMSLDDEMRAIGPLDPIIWDRNLLKQLFGFDYVWEVYKKPKDRLWGYYVYPILYKGEFVARFEAKMDQKVNTLNIFNFNKEEKFDFDNESVNALDKLLNRWKNMIKAEQIIYEDDFLTKLI